MSKKIIKQDEMSHQKKYYLKKTREQRHHAFCVLDGELRTLMAKYPDDGIEKLWSLLCNIDNYTHQIEGENCHVV
jgi:hypothetical protein